MLSPSLFRLSPPPTRCYTASGYRSGGGSGKRHRWDVIYRPSWEKFFKRFANKKGAGSSDAPHFPVSSLWSLQMQDAMPISRRYGRNASKYLRPAKEVQDRSKLPYILRQLENRDRNDSPLLAEPATSAEPLLADPGGARASSLFGGGVGAGQAPHHGGLDEVDRHEALTLDDHPFLNRATSSADLRHAIEAYAVPAATGERPDTFLLHRLHRICAQYDLYWESKGDNRQYREGLKAPENMLPYVDEQASILKELALKDIKFTRHRTPIHKSPKWREI